MEKDFQKTLTMLEIYKGQLLKESHIASECQDSELHDECMIEIASIDEMIQILNGNQKSLAMSKLVGDTNLMNMYNEILTRNICIVRDWIIKIHSNRLMNVCG